MNTDDDMDKPVTKRELHAALETWSGALEARLVPRTELAAFRAEVKAEFASFRAEFAALRTELRTELSTELARHANAILVAMRDTIKTALEPHNGVPERIAALEAHRLPERVAALEAQRPAPRRQRRRP